MQAKTKKNRIVIYTIVSLFLMVIDWTRGSQVGSTWAWTVNLLGVLLCVTLITADGWQNYFSKKYFCFSLVMIVSLPLAYLFWNTHQTLIYRDKLLTAILNVWSIGICFIRLHEIYFKEKNKKPSIKKIPILVFIMLGWMFLSVNEDVWPCWFLALFIVGYFWPITNSGKQELVEGVLNGIILSFFVLQGLAFVFRPFDDPSSRYCGIYSNPNMNALFYCIVLVAFLVRLYQLRRKNASKWRRIICYLLAGVMIAFVILTVCKTAWVTVFLLLLLYVAVADIQQLKMKWYAALGELCLLLLITVLCVPIAYGTARYLPPLFHHPIWYEGEYSEARVHSWDPIDSSKYVSFDESMGTVVDRIYHVLRKILPSNMNVSIVRAEEIKDPKGIHIGDKFYPFEDEETNKYSSYLGRLAIWYYYATHGNLLGHSNTQGHYVGVGKSYIWHGQNAFLQIWFYYGIPAGILFLVVSWGTWGISLRKAWIENGERTDSALLVVMYLSLFLLYGLFEAVWYPGQMILTMTLFGPKLIMREEKQKDN